MGTSALKIVGWNAAATLGVALTSSAVTLALTQLGHYSLDVPQDIKKLHPLPFGFLLSWQARLQASMYVKKQLSFQWTSIITLFPRMRFQC